MHINVCSYYYSCLTVIFYFNFRYKPDLPLKAAKFNAMKHFATTSCKMLLLFGFYFVLLVLIFCYGMIFRTTRRHARQIQAESMKSPSGSDGKAEKKSTMKTDIKIAKLMALVFGLFYLSYVPSTILTYITWFVKSLQNNTALHILRICTTNLIIVNSVLNPITYAYKSTPFRRAFQAILKSKSSVLEWEN